MMVFAYALVTIHLVLIFFTTNYKTGLMKLIPLPIHGWIELIAGMVFIILSFTLFSNDPAWIADYHLCGAKH